MAYRKVHDSFWTDPYIEELTPEQKFFYLYLLTNPSVNQIGLYEFSYKRACFETGYNRDTIEKLLNYFEEAEKVIVSRLTQEILVVKFWFHNSSTSPKVFKHIKGLLSSVKDKSLIQKIYSIDTVLSCMDTVSNSINTASQEEEEQEEEIKKKEEGSKIPSLLEVQEYFENNGYKTEVAEKAFNVYNTSLEANPRLKYWRDSKGNQIKNWKMKMQSVWFKEENLSTPKDSFNPDHAKQLYGGNQ